MLKIGLIGCGYWGKHYLRILSRLPCELIGIADTDPQKKKLAESFGVKYFREIPKLLKKVDAVAVVTPPETHYKIARLALRRGKHVLLEKPFVFKSSQATELREMALNSRLVLSPGLVYLYNPAVIKLKKMIDQGTLGKIYYITLDWLNLGIIRHDVNALWNFGPHPFSILFNLINRFPEAVSAIGNDFIQKGIEDFVICNLKYPDGMIVGIKLSWLHPEKVRSITVVGSKKLAKFDDTSAASPLEIYDKGITPEEFKQAQNWENFAEFKSKTRYGAVEMPDLDKTEPLKN